MKRFTAVRFKQKLRLIFGLALIASLLCACAATRSSRSEENDFSGRYAVISQSRGKSSLDQFVTVKFFDNGPDVNGGLSAGYLKIGGLSTPGAWAFPECGDPGDHTKGVYSGNADTENIEVIRCRNPKDVRAMPEVFFVKTKDGRAFRYSRGPLDLTNSAVDIPANGRLLVFWWVPYFHVAYVLKAGGEEPRTD